MQVQQRVGLRNVLLERKQEAMKELLEKQTTILSEIGAANMFEPDTLVELEKRVETFFNDKYTRNKKLQFQLSKVVKMYNNLLTKFRTKAKEMDMDAQNIGFDFLSLAGGNLSTTSAEERGDF